MSIRVACPGCQKTIKAPEHYAGRIAKCPNCQAAIKIPDSPKLPDTSLEVEPTAAPVPMHYHEAPPQPVPRVAVSVEHDHSAKRGFFRAAFGGMFGCLLALTLFGVLCLGGCLVFGSFLTGTVDAVEEARQRNAKIAEQHTAARAQLVQVLSSSFESAQDYLSGPTFAIEVRNDADKPVTRVSFHCRVVSPSRSVPWGEGDITYAVPGGIEPGEVAEWRLTPNPLSDLRSINPKGDVQLELKVTDVSFHEGS